MKSFVRRIAKYLGLPVPASAEANAAAAAMRRPEPFTAANIDATPDSARDFAYKILWFAIRAPDPQAVVSALQLGSAVPANWSSGLAAAYDALNSRSSTSWAFVSPAVKGWVFLVSAALPYPAVTGEGAENAGKKFDDVVKRLTQHFDEVQFFGSYRVVGLAAWARYKGGHAQRVFSVGDEVYANMGMQTAEEAQLGFTNLSNLSEQEAESRLFCENGNIPGESDVLLLAAKWSLDPSCLSELQTEPSLGLLLHWPEAWTA